MRRGSRLCTNLISPGVPELLRTPRKEGNAKASPGSQKPNCLSLWAGRPNAWKCKLCFCINTCSHPPQKPPSGSPQQTYGSVCLGSRQVNCSRRTLSLSLLILPLEKVPYGYYSHVSPPSTGAPAKALNIFCLQSYTPSLSKPRPTGRDDFRYSPTHTCKLS